MRFDQTGLSFRQAEFTGYLVDPSLAPPDLMKQIQALLEEVGCSHSPVILETYGFAEEQKIHFERIPEFGIWYPAYRRINLVDALVKGAFQDVIHTIRNLSCTVVMSYHLALCLYLLEVPVYLLGFNAYYQQKQRSLGQMKTFPGDYLGNGEVVSQQNAWIKKVQEQRRLWLSELSDSFWWG